MGYLLANVDGKIEGRESDDLFSGLDFSDSKRFEADSLLGENEWWKIDRFRNTDYCKLDFLKNESFNSQNYNPLSSLDTNKIKYIVSYQDDNLFCFQKIAKVNKLRKVLSLNGQRMKLQKSNFIRINDIPDAVYNRNNDTLYFKNPSSINSIFPGINEIEKIATDSDVNNFISNSFISLATKFNSKSINLPNRKRIAEACKIWNEFEEDEKIQIKNYILQFYPDFRMEKDKFVAENDKDLTLLLWGIEQRFFFTPIDNEKRIANSIQKI